MTTKTRAWRTVTLVAAGLALAGADIARAGCIDEPVTSAARMHEFEMLMMNVSLRCTRIGVAMQVHYETMVSTHQRTFDAAARRLQGYFSNHSTVEGHHGGLYDRYATLIANRYGGGNTSLDSCRLFDAVAVEIARAVNQDGVLGALAQAMVAHPVLERATCPGP